MRAVLLVFLLAGFAMCKFTSNKMVDLGDPNKIFPNVITFYEQNIIVVLDSMGPSDQPQVVWFSIKGEEQATLLLPVEAGVGGTVSNLLNIEGKIMTLIMFVNPLTNNNYAIITVDLAAQKMIDQQGMLFGDNLQGEISLQYPYVLFASSIPQQLTSLGTFNLQTSEVSPLTPTSLYDVYLSRSFVVSDSTMYICSLCSYTYNLTAMSIPDFKVGTSSNVYGCDSIPFGYSSTQQQIVKLNYTYRQTGVHLQFIEVTPNGLNILPNQFTVYPTGEYVFLSDMAVVQLKTVAGNATILDSIDFPDYYYMVNGWNHAEVSLELGVVAIGVVNSNSRGMFLLTFDGN